mmetsp:Transcript_10783/g.19573  ORF Transcript_10783/g.19573 Transcript_10783/m.19573 type:complete len:202 (+) Transcript_10783:606-1211(+)
MMSFSSNLTARADSACSSMTFFSCALVNRRSWSVSSVRVALAANSLSNCAPRSSTLRSILSCVAPQSAHCRSDVRVRSRSLALSFVSTSCREFFIIEASSFAGWHSSCKFASILRMLLQANVLSDFSCSTAPFIVLSRSSRQAALSLTSRCKASQSSRTLRVTVSPKAFRSLHSVAQVSFNASTSSATMLTTCCNLPSPSS